MLFWGVFAKSNMEGASIEAKAMPYVVASGAAYTDE